MNDSNETQSGSSDSKRFKTTPPPPLELVPLIESRRQRRLRELQSPSRVLRDRPNVRLDRHLLYLVKREVESDPLLHLQDVVEEALCLWLTMRERSARPA